MKKLLIFATIALLFAFAVQEKVHSEHPHGKKNRTRPFNYSKLFNNNETCPRGFRFSRRQGKCVKRVHPHFNPKFNATNCTKGKKLTCRTKNNLTLCFCRSNVTLPRRNHTGLKLKCPRGTSRRCNSKNGTFRCYCKAVMPELNLNENRHACPVGTYLKYKMEDGQKYYYCKEKKHFKHLNHTKKLY